MPDACAQAPPLDITPLKAYGVRNQGVPSVREETQATSICVYCKLPITPGQRPSVKLKDGREAHADCWNEYEDIERRR